MVDFSAPYRILTPTLDGPVLRALAGVEGHMTRAQIQQQVEDASEAGIRKTLVRLVEQGIVIEDRIGSRYTYAANREHLLWPAVETLLSARRLLADKVEETTMRWEIPPISVELFGSVAQGASTESSDIDLLIVRPQLDDEESDTWDEQVGELHDSVVRWTGNACDIVTLDPDEFGAALERDDPVATSYTNTLAGVRAIDIPALRDLRTAVQRAWASTQLLRAMESAHQAAAAQAGLEDLSKSILQNFKVSDATRSALLSATATSPATQRTLKRAAREIAQQEDA